MPTRGFKPERIINWIRRAEVDLSQGRAVAPVRKKMGITEWAYYR